MNAKVKETVLGTIQSGFPIAPDPYGTLADQLGFERDEVEKALLMPSAIIGEYTARKAQSDSAHAVHKEYNWTKVFDED